MDPVIISDTSSPPQTPIKLFDPSLTLLRLKRIDFLTVYISLLVLTVLFLVVIYVGEKNDWYRSLKQAHINPWFVRGLWLVGTILSYVTFFFISQDIRFHDIPRDLILSVLFVIADFLFLAWSASFYYSQNLSLPFWVSVIIFVYNLWLFIYVWNINSFASLFLIPNLILYLYLIYSTIHLASINNTPM